MDIILILEIEVWSCMLEYITKTKNATKLLYKHGLMAQAFVSITFFSFNLLYVYNWS